MGINFSCCSKADVIDVRGCSRCYYQIRCTQLKCGHYICATCYDYMNKQKNPKCPEQYCYKKLKKNGY